MDPFFMYVSIGALVLLILILIAIGVAMTELRSLDPYPPTKNACPDYWDVSSNPAYCGIPVGTNMKNQGIIASDGSNSVDMNKAQNIGMCKAGTSNFGCVATGASDTYLKLNPTKGGPNSNFQYVQLNNNNNWSTLYPGMSERCAQKSWAQTLNVSWDGVTNYNGC